MAFEIQAKGKYGDWDSEYVSGDPNATTFESREEAEQAISEIRNLGAEWAAGDYRVVKK